MPAIVTRSFGQCAIEDLAVRALGPRDVHVRIEASGICHSDISACFGTLPGPLPVVLGHEGAGTVLEIGREVTLVRVGDRVVLSAVASCGLCWFCSRGEPNLCREVRSVTPPSFVENGEPVRTVSALGTFTDALVLDERAVVRVDSGLPSELLALIGCAVLTGAGAVLNYTRTRPGDSVLVIGAGGVGLSSVQAARACGAVVVAAVDPSDTARRAALASGATHVADPSDVDAVEELLALTSGRGFDAALECVGSAATFGLAWRMLRRGGEMVGIGVGGPGAVPTFPISEIPLSGRRITGCVYGGSSVRRDVPILLDLAHQGRLDLAALLGRCITLAEAPAVILGEQPNRGPGRTVIVNR